MFVQFHQMECMKMQFEFEKIPNKDRDIFIIKELNNMEKKGAF